MRLTPPDRRYAGYIFDCDGTLVESMPLHHRAWLRAFELHRAPFDFDWKLFTSRAGMPPLQTVAELNIQFGTRLDPERVTADYRAIYRQLMEQVTPIEEVVRFAREVHEFAPISVASGGDRLEVEHALARTGLLDLFCCVITAEDVTHGKPDPEVLLCCAQRMGVAPGRCVVVEDGVLGIEAAERAGMDWVRVAEPEGSDPHR
jgi:HAD superfamily hydrolase (TIGR01509 family)